MRNDGLWAAWKLFAKFNVPDLKSKNAFDVLTTVARVNHRCKVPSRGDELWILYRIKQFYNADHSSNVDKRQEKLLPVTFHHAATSRFQSPKEQMTIDPTWRILVSKSQNR